MTPETERERRANFIIRNAEQYGNDPLYRTMVDQTVFLTQEQKEKSQLEVDRVYGWRVGLFWKWPKDNPGFCSK